MSFDVLLCVLDFIKALKSVGTALKFHCYRKTACFVTSKKFVSELIGTYIKKLNTYYVVLLISIIIPTIERF